MVRGLIPSLISRVPLPRSPVSCLGEATRVARLRRILSFVGYPLPLAVALSFSGLDPPPRPWALRVCECVREVKWRICAGVDDADDATAVLIDSCVAASSTPTSEACELVTIPPYQDFNYSLVDHSPGFYCVTHLGSLRQKRSQQCLLKVARQVAD